MQFKAGDLTIQANVQERSKTVSPFSGKDLLQLEVTFTSNEEMSAEISAALRQPAFLIAEGTTDLPEPLPLTLHQKTYSYTVNNPRQMYIWTLMGKEEFSLNTLQVAEMTFEPYMYLESIEDGALFIDARIEVDEATHKQVRDLKPYFQVVRDGISDSPRSMRCGQLLWSSSGDDKFKLRLYLVEESHDAKSRARIFEPQFGNVSTALAVAGERIAKLTALLEEKQIITKQEADDTMNVSSTELADRLDQFYEVDDLDQWLGADGNG